jgi:hypothetical protein
MPPSRTGQTLGPSATAAPAAPRWPPPFKRAFMHSLWSRSLTTARARRRSGRDAAGRASNRARCPKRLTDSPVNSRAPGAAGPHRVAGRAAWERGSGAARPRGRPPPPPRGGDGGGGWGRRGVGRRGARTPPQRPRRLQILGRAAPQPGAFRIALSTSTTSLNTRTQRAFWRPHLPRAPTAACPRRRQAQRGGEDGLDPTGPAGARRRPPGMALCH